MEEKDVVKKKTKRISDIDKNKELTKKIVSEKEVKKPSNKKIEDVKKTNTAKEAEKILDNIKVKKTTKPKREIETAKKTVSKTTKKISEKLETPKETKSSKGVGKVSKDTVEKNVSKKLIDVDDELQDIFEKSSSAVKPKNVKIEKKQSVTERIKRENIETDPNEAKKKSSSETLSTKKSATARGTTTRSDAKTKNVTNQKATTKRKSPEVKSSTAKKVGDTAAVVKKKITEEVTKASSETSSKIKINKNQKNSDESRSVRKKSSTNTSHTANELKSDTTKKKNTKSKVVVHNKEDIKKEDDEYTKKIDITHLDDELEDKFDINVIDEELKKRKEVPKDNLIKIVKESVSGLIYAVVFIAFLIFANYAFYNFAKISFSKDINIFAFIFLGMAIMQIEVSYTKEDTQKCISGIETLLMGIYTLSLPYISQLYALKFTNIIIASGIIIGLYYIIKSVITFLQKRSKFLRDKEDFTKEQSGIDPDLEDDDDEEDEF